MELMHNRDIILVRNLLNADTNDSISMLLLMAIVRGHLECIKILLNTDLSHTLRSPDGSIINFKTIRGRTPLMIAIILKRINIVKMLLEAGANLNVQDNDGLTVLHYAVMNDDNLELIKLLLSYSPNRCLKDKRGLTPSSYAYLNDNHPLAPLNYLIGYKEFITLCKEYDEFPVKGAIDNR